MLLEFVRTRFPGLLSSELEFRSSSIGGLFFLLLVEEGLALMSSAAQFGGVLLPLALRLPRLPFPLAPPLFLLCSPLDSVKLASEPGAAAADLALFPRPRPPLISRSLVGDSQNLGKQVTNIKMSKFQRSQAKSQGTQCRKLRSTPQQLEGRAQIRKRHLIFPLTVSTPAK